MNEKIDKSKLTIPIYLNMHTNIFDVTNYAQLDLKQIYFYTILNLMRPRCQSLMRIMMILH